MEEYALDVMAVGAHPDDVEIGCGGALARLVQQGYRVGIVDLTDGEPTPGSAGPEVRLAEARKAAQTLGLCRRVTLALPNRRLFDTFEARVAVAIEIRRSRPKLVLALGGKTPSASPDHAQAALIAEAATFYAKLGKWDAEFAGLPPAPQPLLLHYHLALRSLMPAPPNALIVDIGDTLEMKIAAIACYATQFAHRPEILDRIRIFSQQQGMAAGFAAGEMLASPTALGTGDLMGLLFGRA
jgi:bacillithiol biosynthesis deacetylase BshB1